MSRRLQAALLLSFALLCVIGWPANTAGKQSTTANETAGQGTPAPLSDRIVSYRIDAKYDNGAKSLEGTETLVYQNKTGQALSRFPFHLYLNGFQPESSWMREARRDDPEMEWEESMRGSIQLLSISAEGFGDLKSSMRFTAPDDGNPSDRTVAEVTLPRALAPGESITFKIAFSSKFPQVVARTGYKRDFIMGAQWFPKVGVWWKGAWNAHQFHEATEFFADFGVYDVNLTLPANFVVGATGVATSQRTNPDGTQTTSFHAEDVHDFAWAADPRFVVTEEEFSGSHKVKMRLLMLREHRGQTERHMNALRETMRLFEEWFGPYPYQQITVIDPAGSRAEGMEYPTLITGGTFWGMPKGVHVPESVIVHEFGHQYWYAMVANNEFEEPWLDEGINSYCEIKVLERMFGRDASYSDWLGAQMGARGDYWRDYITRGERDPVGSSAVTMLDRSSVLTNAYDKTALMFLTLESLIGEDGVRRGLRTYFERNRFKHPTGEDLIAAMEESSGKDLRWFFDQAIRGTEDLDYAVSANSDEMLESTSQAKDPLYRTEVVVQRKGEFVFPVSLVVSFENGERVYEQWDGKNRWKRFTYEKRTRVMAAAIDPEHKVWLDRSRFNDSYTVTPDRRATRKLTAYWIVAVQALQQMIGWLS